MSCRQHHNRYSRIALAQLAQDRKAIPIRQIELQQNKIDLRLLRDEPDGFMAAGGFDDAHIARHLLEGIAQRFANEKVSIDDQNARRRPLQRPTVCRPQTGGRSGRIGLGCREHGFLQMQAENLEALNITTNRLSRCPMKANSDCSHRLSYRTLVHARRHECELVHT